MGDEISTSFKGIKIKYVKDMQFWESEPTDNIPMFRAHQLEEVENEIRQYIPTSEIAAIITPNGLNYNLGVISGNVIRLKSEYVCIFRTEDGSIFEFNNAVVLKDTPENREIWKKLSLKYKEIDSIRKNIEKLQGSAEKIDLSLLDKDKDEDEEEE